MIHQIQFENEKSEEVKSFFRDRDFEFKIFPKLNLNEKGYLLTIEGTEENIEKLISLMKDNDIYP